MLAAFPNSTVVVPDVFAPTNQVLVNFSDFAAGSAALKTLLKDVGGAAAGCCWRCVLLT
jgi:hypothetical protein